MHAVALAAYFAGLELTALICYSIGSWAQCYKTFYVCNLKIFIASYSVCPWPAFLA
jgi:hypothetical protein